MQSTWRQALNYDCIENFEVSLEEISSGAVWAWEAEAGLIRGKGTISHQVQGAPPQRPKTWQQSKYPCFVPYSTSSVTACTCYSMASAEGLGDIEQKWDWKLLFTCFQYISPDTPAENKFARILALQGKNRVKSRFAELSLREHTWAELIVLICQLIH